MVVVVVGLFVCSFAISSCSQVEGLWGTSLLSVYIGISSRNVEFYSKAEVKATRVQTPDGSRGVVGRCQRRGRRGNPPNHFDIPSTTKIIICVGSLQCLYRGAIFRSYKNDGYGSQG